MNSPKVKPGAFMAAEIAQAPKVFADAIGADHGAALRGVMPSQMRAIYTIGRGSSDAAAMVLSYEFMRHLGVPVTSLPPSIFSLYDGVGMKDAVGLVISQSGASDDLVACAKGIKRQNGRVVGITNAPDSAIEKISDLTLAINAGAERAVPATKTVIGSIGVGLAMLGALVPAYRERALFGAQAMQNLAAKPEIDLGGLQSSLLRADHVYVVGRGAGLGAAYEVALKLKETAALHAEAYSASEVLHGPLQLVTNPLFVLIIDTGEPETQASLDRAEERFKTAGGEVFRLRPPGDDIHCAATMAAMALYLLYPVILGTTLALGLDPDSPSTLSKVTRTS